jgi:hypothetical protein
MSWRGVVWREAGSWDGIWTAGRDLGTHEFPEQPEIGQEIEFGDKRYCVIERDVGFVVVKPNMPKAR